MSRLSETLSRRADELGITQTQIAERLGMAQQSISELFRGNVASPRKWKSLATLLQIDEKDMLEMMNEAAPPPHRGGQKLVGEQWISPSAEDIRNSAIAESNARIMAPIPPQMTERMIPVLGEAVGGSDGEYIFNGQVLEYIAAPPSLVNVRDAYAVFVDGESMYPRYRSGETVYAHPSRPARRGDDVIVQLRPTAEGSPPRGYVKEFVGWTAQNLVLSQHNPVREIRFAKDDVISVHPIVFAGKY